MDTGGSKTATLVAGYRARASAKPDPICSDPWAAALAGAEGATLTQRFDAAFEHAELWIALRTATLDEQIDCFTKGHARARQVVIGAGLDTRGPPRELGRALLRGRSSEDASRGRSWRVSARSSAIRLTRRPTSRAISKPRIFLRSSSAPASTRPRRRLWSGKVRRLPDRGRRPRNARAPRLRLLGRHRRALRLRAEEARRRAGQRSLDLATRDVVADSSASRSASGLRSGAAPLRRSDPATCAACPSTALPRAHGTLRFRGRKFRFQHVAAASRATPITL